MTAAWRPRSWRASRDGAEMEGANGVTTRPAEATSTAIYEAVIALSRSIAGRSDIESLLAGVSESLRRIVNFDYIGVALRDAKSNRMHGRLLESSDASAPRFNLGIDDDPAGWVWQH